MLTGQAQERGVRAFDYVIRGRAIGGFGRSRIRQIRQLRHHDLHRHHDGKVYEADLGPKSAERAAKAMKRFDAGKGWSAVPTK